MLDPFSEGSWQENLWNGIFDIKPSQYHFSLELWINIISCKLWKSLKMINYNNAPDHKLANILQQRYQVYHLLSLNTSRTARIFSHSPQLSQKNREREGFLIWYFSRQSEDTRGEMLGMVSQLLSLLVAGYSPVCNFHTARTKIVNM